MPRVMSLFMGFFFSLLAMFKFFDVKAFVKGFQMYDIVATRFRIYGYAYPFIELALGLSYLRGSMLIVTNIITVVVMSLSALGVITSVRKAWTFAALA